MKTLSLLLLFLWLVGDECLAVQIVRLHPGAVRPGTTVEIKVEARDVQGKDTEITLWTSFSARLERLTTETENDSRKARFALTVPADEPPGFGTIRVVSKWGISEPRIVVIDDLPTIPASSGSGFDEAQLLVGPSAVEATSKGLESHYFRVSGVAGQRLAVEILGRRIGSEFDAYLRILDSSGNVCAVADDDDALGADCQLAYTFEVDETVWIEVRDVAYRQFLFRLRVGDFPLVSSTTPLGAERGTDVEVAFVTAPGERVAPVPVRAPKRGRDALVLAARLSGGTSAALATLGLSALTQVSERPGHAETRVEGSCTLNGTLHQKREQDSYGFRAQAEEIITFTGLSRSLGSPAYLRMAILNATGEILAHSGERNTDEEALVFKFPHDGEYSLRINDLLNRGGPGYGYRVEVCRGGTFVARLQGSDRLLAVPGGEFYFEVECERQGYDGPVDFQLHGEHGTYEPVGTPRLKAGNSRTRIHFRTAPDSTPYSVDTLRIEAVGSTLADRRPRRVSTEEALRRHARHLEHVPATIDGDLVLKVLPPTARCSMAPLLLEVGVPATTAINIERPFSSPNVRQRLQFTIVGLPKEIEASRAFRVPAESLMRGLLLKAIGIPPAAQESTRMEIRVQTRVEGIELLLPTVPLHLKVVEKLRRKRL